MQLSLAFALELALALSIKRYTFPNDYNLSLKVNSAVELLFQETFQLSSAMHSSVTLLLLLCDNWSSRQLNTGYIYARTAFILSFLFCNGFRSFRWKGGCVKMQIRRGIIKSENVVDIICTLPLGGYLGYRSTCGN